MNIESLRKHLAIEVRGWQLELGTQTELAHYYAPKKYNHNLASDEQSYEVLVKDWKPDENIKQVMECFDAIATEKIGWSLYLNCKPQQHVCEIYEWTHNGTEKTRLSVEVNHKKELAASVALAKATGWKE